MDCALKQVGVGLNGSSSGKVVWSSQTALTAYQGIAHLQLSHLLFISTYQDRDPLSLRPSVPVWMRSTSSGSLKLMRAFVLHESIALKRRTFSAFRLRLVWYEHPLMSQKRCGGEVLYYLRLSKAWHERKANRANQFCNKECSDLDVNNSFGLQWILGIRDIHGGASGCSCAWASYYFGRKEPLIFGPGVLWTHGAPLG